MGEEREYFNIQLKNDLERRKELKTYVGEVFIEGRKAVKYLTVLWVVEMCVVILGSIVISTLLFLTLLLLLIGLNGESWEVATKISKTVLNVTWYTLIG